MTKAEEKGEVMIKLISSDNEIFEVSESVASLSTTINNMIEDGCAEGGIPLPNVTGSVLAKVLEYCNKHAAAKAGEPSKANDYAAESSEAGGSSDDHASSSSAAATPGKKALRRFDEELMEEVDLPMLLQIVSAANYLNVKDLLDLTSQAIADRIKDKSSEEMREILGIVNDFTPEEEAEIRAQNAWAFD